MASQRTDGTGSRSYTSLRHRDFRLLWAAEGVSLTGSQVQRVAVAWTVFQLTGDPLALGLLGLCRFVPVILFGIAGGVIADRYDRRRLLILCQVILIATSGVLALLSFTGQLSLLAIYAITILSSTVESVSNPTRQALIPLLVPREDLPGATTMNLLIFQLASVGGPALGGLMIGFLGVSYAYLFDAITFSAVLIGVLMMRSRPELPPVTMSGFAAALEGLTFLKGTPVLLGVMVTDFLATLFGAATLLMPIFAEEILNTGPEGLGLLLSAPAAGAVTVATIMGIIRLPSRPGIGVLVSVALYGVSLIGFGLSRDLWLSLLFLAGSGAADSVSTTLRGAIRVLLVPDALRGRIAAVHRTMAVSGPQLGEFEAGVLAALIGAGPAVVVGGVGTIVVALIVARVVPAIAKYRIGDELAWLEPVAASPPPGPKEARP